jgi:uncharacterized membrane protein YhaH (DUF805 family)
MERNKRWELSGPLYAVYGIQLAAIKRLIDLFVANRFGYHWPYFDLRTYWLPLGRAIRLIAATSNERHFLMAMFAVAAPFIFAGIVLTALRLRTLKYSPVWALLFFVPVLNLPLFVFLIFAWRRGKREAGSRYVDRLEAVAVTLAATTVVGVATAAFCIYAASSYGLGLFCGVPIAMGMVTALCGYRLGLREFRTVALLAVASEGLCACLLLAFAMEGALCLVMALPLALPLAILGVWLGSLCVRQPDLDAPAVTVSVLLLSPVLATLSVFLPARPSLHSVETDVEIAAAPEIVWQNVIRFPDLPEPHELMFRLGLAYPQRATIKGAGPGAVRYCEFSTGAFVEPIRIWQEPRLLRFSVTHNPEPMRELSPYHSLHTPHLDGYFASEQGQFLLDRLPNGHTLLRGTTWYHIDLQPERYWQAVSDRIVHQIHLRVLRHIKRLSETQVLSTGATSSRTADTRPSRPVVASSDLAEFLRQAGRCAP